MTDFVYGIENKAYHDHDHEYACSLQALAHHLREASTACLRPRPVGGTRYARSSVCQMLGSLPVLISPCSIA
jgi:hypothetical protein